MNIRKIVCAAAVFGCVASATAAGEPADAEKGEVEETPVVSAEFSISFDSKYMTYGVVDGKDPIVTPGATVTFLDWVYGSVEAIYDVTKGNGKRGGYGNRAGKYTTLDATAGVAHEFDLGESLGALGVDFNYIYEYIPTCRHTGDGCPDTQYLNLELSLGDLWLEPTLAIERDLMADDGTYVNLEIGHTFALVGGGEEPTLTFRPSVAQGLGNSLRTKGYFADSSDGFSHGGLMDTTIKGEFELAICENVTLGAYIAYSDYWLDSNMRDAARAYNAEWGKGSDRSWNVYGGLALTVSF